MTISNEPEISKEIQTLLTRGIAGQRGKSKATGMVIRFTHPVFPEEGFSKGILLMTRFKWTNQRDICDQISRRHKSVGGTGHIEASHAGNNVTAVARGKVICSYSAHGTALGLVEEGSPALVANLAEQYASHSWYIWMHAWNC
jgi:hypothetical protein